MKLLLTGSNGFIGNYFQNKYKNTYTIETFSFLQDDLNDLNLMDIDTVIHLSALVHQMGGASKEEYWRVNVENTITLAKKAKQSGVKHFIFMSSVKVYGEESNTPYSEMTICVPQDDYGRSKFEAENQLKMLEDENFIVSIIRTPIVYGYGVKANILNLINLIKKVPILPFGNIENRRSMVYIGNLNALINVIIQKEESGIFLASDNRPLSTSELITMIAKTIDKKIYLLQLPLFETFLKSLKPSFHKRLYENLEIDNQITKKILDFENPYCAEEGIDYMIHGEKI